MKQPYLLPLHLELLLLLLPIMVSLFLFHLPV